MNRALLTLAGRQIACSLAQGKKRCQSDAAHRVRPIFRGARRQHETNLLEEAPKCGMHPSAPRSRFS